MTIKRLMLLASALTMLFLHRAEGQLNFSVRITSVQPPSVVSWFQAYCNGGWIADIKPSELQITEDGFPVKNMTIRNDDPNKRRFISLMLLAQNSTSMDSIFPFMKNTVRTYIDSMGLSSGSEIDEQLIARRHKIAAARCRHVLLQTLDRSGDENESNDSEMTHDQT